MGELNGQYVKVAKARDSYFWHHHDKEDELFLVVKGTLDIHVKDPTGTERVVSVGEGEFYIVPRGVEHKPVARRDETHFVLFEPRSTRKDGDVDEA